MPKQRYTVTAEKQTRPIDQLAEEIQQLAGDMMLHKVTPGKVRQYADAIMHKAADVHYSANELCAAMDKLTA